MTTAPSRFLALPAGQAVVVDQQPWTKAVLTRGEVLLMAPAEWIAGTVHQPAPQRVAAPAEFPLPHGHAIRAVGGDANLLVELRPGLAESFAMVWNRLRPGSRPTQATGKRVLPRDLGRAAS